MNKIIYYIIGILVLIGLVYFISKLAFTPSPSLITSTSIKPISNISYATSLIQLTDPPQFPNGTQSLILNYSNIALHETGKSNSTGFVNLNYSGSINIYNLTNLTQTIGVAKFPKNMTFDMIRLNISNAQITINNKTYNITVPGNKILIKFNKNLNSSYNLSLIDLVSSVVQIYSANQTLFILVPSARAVVVSNYSINATNRAIGAKIPMHPAIKHEIENSKPNISITNAFISSSNNITNISVTVKNNGNASVVLRNLFINGYMQLQNPHAFNANIRGKVNMQPTGLSKGLVNNVTSIGKSVISNVSEIMGNKNITNMVNNITSSIINANALPISNNTRNQVSDALEYLKNNNKNWNLTSITSQLSTYLSHLNQSSKQKILGIISNKTNLSVIGDMHNFNISSFKNIMDNVTKFNDNYHNMLNFIILQNGSLSLPFMKVNGLSSPSPQLPVNNSSSGLSANSLVSQNISISNNSSATNSINNSINSNSLISQNLSVSEQESHQFNVNESDYSNFSKWSAIGYTLQANQSKTFTFDSKIQIGNSPLAIKLLNNQTYVLRIIGNNGANFQVNVTAT